MTYSYCRDVLTTMLNVLSGQELVDVLWIHSLWLSTAENHVAHVDTNQLIMPVKYKKLKTRKSNIQELQDTI